MKNLSPSLLALFVFVQLLLLSCQLTNGVENFYDFELLKSQEITRCRNKLRSFKANKDAYVEDKSPYESEIDPETNKPAKYNWQPCKNCNSLMGNGQQQAYNVKQGKNSKNCWLMSAIIGLFTTVNQQGSVTVLVNDEVNPSIFGVMLYPDGIPTCVIVDGLIPHTDAGEIRFASSDDGALYPLIVEKALAKHFRGYQALTGGYLNEGHFYLTGGTCRIYSALPKDAPNVPDVCNSDFCISSTKLAAIEKIKKEAALGSILYGNINIGSNGAVKNSNGLVTGHTYAMEWISMDGIILVKIYDQGRGSTWSEKGAFSKNSPNWNEPQYRRLKERYFHELNKPGLFFLTLDELLENYTELYACDAGHQNGPKKITNGLFPQYLETANILSYGFEVTDATVPVHLSLMQHHARSSSSSSAQHKLSKYRYPVVLVLYRMGVSHWEYYTSSCFEGLFTNSISMNVPKGRYLVIAYSPCPMTRLFRSIYSFSPDFSLFVYYDRQLVSNFDILPKEISSLEY